MSSLNIENYDPEVGIAGGLNTDLPVDFSGAATVALPAGTTINGSSLTALGTITSSSAQALAVGLNGLTNPAFNVDSSTASQADGVNVKGLAAGNGAGIKVITSGTNAPLTIDAAGSGTIAIGATSTGVVTVTPATNFVAGVANLSATSVPASAGAVAAGKPITLFSSGPSIYVTSDVPGFSAVKGSLCINTGGSSSSTRLYVNNGTTNWVAVTTAS